MAIDLSFLPDQKKVDLSFLPDQENKDLSFLPDQPEEKMRLPNGQVDIVGEQIKKQRNDFSENITEQFVMGLTDEYLLGFPEYAAEKLGGTELVKSHEARGFLPRTARGVGRVAGFSVGLPQKILVGGGKLGIKGLQLARKGQQIGRFGKAAAAGAGAFGLFELAKAPEESFKEKVVTVPLATAVGGALGVGTELIRPLASKGFAKIMKKLKGGKTEEAVIATNDFVQDAVVKSKDVKGNINNLIKANKLSKAQSLINSELKGTEQIAAQSELNIAKLKGVGSPKKRINDFLNQGLYDDAQYVINNELKGIDQITKQSALNVARNKPIDAAGIVTSRVAGIVPDEQIPQRSVNEIKRIQRAHILDNNITATSETVLRGQGPAGEKLATTLRDIEKFGEIKAGGARADFLKVTKGFTDKEFSNMTAAIEGRALPVNNRVENAINWWKSTNEEIVKKGVSLNLNVKSFRAADGKMVPEIELLKNSLRPNYFPHMTIPVDAPQSKVKEALLAAVERGDFKSFSRASRAWDSYKNYVQSGKKGEAILQHLVDRSGGKIRNKFEADKILRTFVNRSRQRRFGNLERARDIDLPFYDTDPRTVFPRYFNGAFNRLEEVQQIGLKDEVVTDLLGKIRDGGGDSRSSAMIWNRFSGKGVEGYAFDAISPELAQKLKGLQVVTKLGLATVPNASQSTNTAIKFGLRNTLKSILKTTSSLSKEAAEDFAIRSGAVSDATIETLLQRVTGGGGRFKIGPIPVNPRRFLEFTRFSAIERFNRVVAANAGAEYAKDMTTRLLKNPADKLANRALAELGLSPQGIISRGSLSLEEMFIAANKASVATQFKAGVLDLPLFFTSPNGKFVTQFKSFAYNQTKFIKEAVLQETMRGNFRPLIRAVTLMPIIGEGVADVRALLTGKSRDSKGMARLIENMSAVAGFGIFQDLWKAGTFRRLASTLVGPTISDLVDVSEGIIGVTTGKPRNLGKTVTRQIPIAGQFISRGLFPKEKSSSLSLGSLGKL